MDEGECWMDVLDFGESFCDVSHNILMDKLRHVGWIVDREMDQEVAEQQFPEG